MLIVTIITFSVAAILLAAQSPIVATDTGRLLLVATITALVVCSSVADSMPMIDRLIAACIGGSALYYLVDMALGPVLFRVISGASLIELRKGSYRMQCEVSLA
jgi:hypothetical protein